MSTAARMAATPLPHLRHEPGVRAPHGRDDAELGGACRRGLPGGVNERGHVQPGGPYRRVELAGLRAEVTVFRASAGLEADDPLHLDLRTTPAHPHLVGQGEQIGQRLVREPEHGEHAGLVQPLSALEDLAPCHGEDAGTVLVRRRPRRRRCRCRCGGVRGHGSGHGRGHGCSHRGLQTRVGGCGGCVVAVGIVVGTDAHAPRCMRTHCRTGARMWGRIPEHHRAPNTIEPRTPSSMVVMSRSEP